MNFEAVLSELLKEFKVHGIRHALMGGFAVGLWGGARSTIDLDFLVDRDDLPKLDMIMSRLGFECRFRSENVSQYLSPLKVFGEVDFIHALRDTAREMLARAEDMGVYSERLTIKTLIPEDIIGLKMQAIRNDPARAATDMADIATLVRIRGARMDWSLIEQYCELLDMNDMLAKLKGLPDMIKHETV